MRVLVGFEFTGTVRRAFRARGHEAWSCDLLPAEDGGEHIRGDAREVMLWGCWDLAVLHPVCKRLTNAGVRWLKVPPPGRTLAEMWAEMEEGCRLFSAALNAPIPRLCVENPIMHKYAKARITGYREDCRQVVQPWWFGEPQFKATGLYLKGLPRLRETNRLTPPKPGTDEHKRWSRVHRMSPGPDRERERSRFFPGVAAAMADQWTREAPLLALAAE